MLGIDIGSYAIKLAVTKGSGKKASVSKILYEVVPPEAREKNDIEVKKGILADMIRRVAKTERTAVLSVPTSAAILKTVSLPISLSGDDLEGEIQMALINLIPFPLDQVYMDFVSLGVKKTNPDMQDVLVVATRKAIVDSVADSVNNKNIKEKIVDIEASSIGLLIEVIKGKSYKDVYAVIDIGYNSTNFYVFAKDELVFSREQQVGGQQLTEAISDNMGLSMDDAESTKLNSIGSVPDDVVGTYVETFVEQIALALELCQSAEKRTISGFYLTGGGSNLTALLPALQKGLGSSYVDYLSTSVSVKINDKTDDMFVNTMSSVSIGLALRS